MLPRVLILEPADASRFIDLRLQMLQDSPWAFAASPEDDIAVDEARLAELLEQEQNSIVAVETADDVDGWTHNVHELPLIAAAGIFRMRQSKAAHRATIWGVYVLPGYRGQGLGRDMVGTAINLARSWDGVEYVDLSVSERCPEARSLYERLGFESWGRAPAAIRYDGRYYDEIHMTLRL